MAKKANIKSLIKDLEKEELIEVIVELSKVSKQNDQFIRMFIQGSNKENVESSITDAKKKIETVFFDNGNLREQVNLSLARSFISEYSKLLKDFPYAIIEIKLYYVELGIAVINKVDEAESSFYNSIASMFRDVCNSILKNSTYYSLFSERFIEINESTRNIGYGFHDFIIEQINDLKYRMENE
jgi:phenylalanyl-tRNA synthetase alpha subunit